MAKRRSRLGKTNPHLIELIRNLKKLSAKENANIWRRIANELEKSTRRMREVNVFQINRVTKENDTIIVPGKVLGQGEMSHKVNVAGFRFSESAKNKANVNAITIQELMKKNPKGTGVKIIC